MCLSHTYLFIHTHISKAECQERQQNLKGIHLIAILNHFQVNPCKTKGLICFENSYSKMPSSHICLTHHFPPNVHILKIFIDQLQNNNFKNKTCGLPCLPGPIKCFFLAFHLMKTFTRRNSQTKYEQLITFSTIRVKILIKLMRSMSG